MPLELPKFLTTEYASTAKGTVELHLRQFVIHTQHPRFIAVIEAGRLIPVDLMGHTLSTPELQAALDECADKFGLEFVKLMDALLDDSVGRLIAADLSQGFSLEGLESQAEPDGTKFLTMHPLQPPSAYQKLGWLNQQTHIKCDVALGDFAVGKSYLIASYVVNLARVEKRPRAGKHDTVHVVGDSRAYLIWDGAGRVHVFTIKLPQAPPDVFQGSIIHAWHTFADLIRHFSLPEVPCVAEANPADYYASLSKLASIES